MTRTIPVIIAAFALAGCASTSGARLVEYQGESVRVVSVSAWGDSPPAVAYCGQNFEVGDCNVSD